MTNQIVQYQGHATTNTAFTNPAPPALGSWMGGFSVERIITPAKILILAAALAQFSAISNFVAPPPPPKFLPSPEVVIRPSKAALHAQITSWPPEFPRTPTTPAYSQWPDFFIKGLKPTQQQFAGFRNPPPPFPEGYRSQWPDRFIRPSFEASQPISNPRFASLTSVARLNITEQDDVLAAVATFLGNGGAGPGWQLLFSQDEATLVFLEKCRDAISRGDFERRINLRDLLRDAIRDGVVKPSQAGLDIEPFLRQEKLASSIESNIVSLGNSTNKMRRVLMSMNDVLRAQAKYKNEIELRRREAEDDEELSLIMLLDV